MKKTKNVKFSLFIMQQLVRDFFRSQDFLEVQTPPVVENPGMEPHIHPFQILRSQNQEVLGQYLHTSPEFCMKELLAEGFEKIFTQSFCFRDEPNSPQHRSQFLMLEWYRRNEGYQKIIGDLENLFEFLIKGLSQHKIPINPQLINFNPQRKTINEIFKQVLNLEILDYLDKEDLRELIQSKYPMIPLPIDQAEDLSWDDLYFLLFLNLIEPELQKYPFIILDQFPHHLCALSKISTKDPRTCNRFELYCFGTEIANCFHELENIEEQKKRFKKDQFLKMNLYNYQLPEPQVLYKALERGIGNSSGIALGLERLLGVLTGIENPFY